PGTPVPAAPMDSAPPWAHSAKCRGCSVWSHFGASKLTLSLGPGSGSWNHRLPVGRHRRRLRIRMAVSAARDDHRRNRMLEDELLLVAGLEHHRVLVERSDAACQLHPTNQIDRDVVPFLSCRVEEGILNVLLCRLGFHLPISFFMFRCCAMSFWEGNWLQLSCRSYNTALSRAFQLPAEIYSLACPGAWRAQRSFSGFRNKSIEFHFPRQPSTIVTSRTENRSPDLDRNQPPHRPQHQPSDAVSLAAFCWRHHLAWPAVFFQSR